LQSVGTQCTASIAFLEDVRPPTLQANMGKIITKIMGFYPNWIINKLGGLVDPKGISAPTENYEPGPVL
jgi:hypothetical protein